MRSGVRPACWRMTSLTAAHSSSAPLKLIRSSLLDSRPPGRSSSDRPAQNSATSSCAALSRTVLRPFTSLSLPLAYGVKSARDCTWRSPCIPLAFLRTASSRLCRVSCAGLKVTTPTEGRAASATSSCAFTAVDTTSTLVQATSRPVVVRPVAALGSRSPALASSCSWVRAARDACMVSVLGCWSLVPFSCPSRCSAFPRRYSASCSCGRTLLALRNMLTASSTLPASIHSRARL
mmetsp:Transcript_26405/g.90268  ORF Transcript_26405/g.90268 Transcript_26405/m.90268 type:complete len:235 (+) Transcript_26405:168-872(+)